MIDCHVHTNFSSDGRNAPEDMIASAIAKGVHFIALTDHLDLSKTGTAPQTMRDLSVYYRALSDLKQQYADQITIAIGVECGFAPSTQYILSDMLAPYRFDYIVNSVHDVAGEDVYKPGYFLSRGKQKGFMDYFTAVLQSLDAVYPFDAVGHLCYPERVAPFPDPAAHYEHYSDLIDEIFTKIIRKKIILELNTSTAGLPTPCIPRKEFLIRYRQIGGTRITFSSDAHDINRIGDKYPQIRSLCKSIGFTHFTYRINGTEQTELL